MWQNRKKNNNTIVKTLVFLNNLGNMKYNYFEQNFVSFLFFDMIKANSFCNVFDNY